MQKINSFLKLSLALSLFVAIAAAINLNPAASSTAQAFRAPAVEAAPVPAANSADISFRNARGQEIGEGRPFPLDRVTRGEQFTVIVRAQQYPVKIRVRAANGFQREVLAHSEFRFQDQVPTNPSFDNVTVSVLNPQNGHTLEQRRLPIGRK